MSRLHRQRGDADTALQVASRAHEMAITVGDRKATAQTAATVAYAYLALNDVTAAAQWFEHSLTIAQDTYPFVEARALVGLAAARLADSDPTSASHAAKQALAIASSCGFHLLEQMAAAALQASK